MDSVNVVRTVESFLRDNLWSGLIYFILGIIISYWFYVKSKKEKKPMYTVRGITLVADYLKKFQDIEVLYKQQAVQNLTMSRLMLWNAGNETITERDIPSQRPVTIKLEDNKCSILDFELEEVSNSANNVTLTRVNDREIEVSFEYLDSGEGACVRMFHNARGSSSIKLESKLIGGLQFKRAEGIEFNSSRTNIGRVLSAIAVMSSKKEARTLLKVMSIMIPVFFSLLPVGILLFTKFDWLSALLALVLAIVAFSYWQLAIIINKRTGPKGFDKFFNNEL